MLVLPLVLILPLVLVLPLIFSLDCACGGNARTGGRFALSFTRSGDFLRSEAKVSPSR